MAKFIIQCNHLLAIARTNKATQEFLDGYIVRIREQLYNMRLLEELCTVPDRVGSLDSYQVPTHP